MLAPPRPRALVNLPVNPLYNKSEDVSLHKFFQKFQHLFLPKIYNFLADTVNATGQGGAHAVADATVSASSSQNGTSSLSINGNTYASLNGDAFNSPPSVNGGVYSSGNMAVSATGDNAQATINTLNEITPSHGEAAIEGKAPAA